MNDVAAIFWGFFDLALGAWFPTAVVEAAATALARIKPMAIPQNDLKAILKNFKAVPINVNLSARRRVEYHLVAEYNI